MTRRLFLAQNRLLISLPGYEASHSTPFEGMSFDSDTPFGALVLAKGAFIDPATPYNGNQGLTQNPYLDMICPGLRTGYNMLLLLRFTSGPSALEGSLTLTNSVLQEGIYLNSTTMRLTRYEIENGLYARTQPIADPDNPDDLRAWYYMILVS